MIELYISSRTDNEEILVCHHDTRWIVTSYGLRCGNTWPDGTRCDKVDAGLYGIPVSTCVRIVKG
jgi:hypothetical protein